MPAPLTAGVFTQSGPKAAFGVRSRKQPLAVRRDVATDRFRTECPMSTIGQLRTVKHLPGSGRSIVSLTCFAPSMKGGRWPIRALTACQ